MKTSCEVPVPPFFSRTLLLLFCLVLPSCGSLRAINLLACAAQPDLKFSPTQSPWKITGIDTACFEQRPTITIESAVNADAEQISQYYRDVLSRHGWRLSSEDHGIWVYAYRKRSLPVLVADPLIYRDDSLEIDIDQPGGNEPIRIRITVRAYSHLDFPSAILTWLTGNAAPWKYIF